MKESYGVAARWVQTPNPLVGVFYRRGLIEQWGRGTQKIVDWCVAAGQPEPEFDEHAGAVVVRFPAQQPVPPPSEP